MTHPMNLVREFADTFGVETPGGPSMPTADVQAFRAKLIYEEAEELSNATDLIDYMDAVGDLLYVVYGAALAAGFTSTQVDSAFREIHRSNMSKLWSDDEIDCIPADCRSVRVDDNRHIVRRWDGKIIKSPSYSPAKINLLLP